MPTAARRNDLTSATDGRASRVEVTGRRLVCGPAAGAWAPGDQAPGDQAAGEQAAGEQAAARALVTGAAGSARAPAVQWSGMGDPVPRFGDCRRMRVGLLGGSFNPAHRGHRHVAGKALTKLRLDQVWLLVSPGNPLKPQAGMAPFQDRLSGARRIGDGRRVVASGIEAALRTRYTVDTMRLLMRRFPRVRFVWIMGADILEQLPRWRRWTDIVRRLAFVVLPRPGYTHQALAGLAAHRLRAERRPAREARLLTGAAPGWAFLPGRQNAASATAIRQAAEGHVP